MKKRGATFKRHDPLARFGLASDQQRDIGIAQHASLQAMLSGHGTEQAWSTVAVSLNLALTLCESGICPAAIETIQLAQRALVSSAERAGRTGKWGLSGDEAHIIMAAINLHDKQISQAPRHKVKSALEEVHRRVVNGDVMDIGYA